MQNLPNGGAVVSFGGTKIVKEYGPGGKIVNTLTLTDGSSYRANKNIGYVGIPEAPPDAVAVYSQANDTTTIYMSWNGATEVGSWRVNGQRVPKAGFETVMVFTGLVNNFVVEALGRDASVLRRSGTVVTRNAANAGTSSSTQASTSTSAVASTSTADGALTSTAERATTSTADDTPVSTATDASKSIPEGASTCACDASGSEPTETAEVIGPVVASRFLVTSDGMDMPLALELME